MQQTHITSAIENRPIFPFDALGPLSSSNFLSKTKLTSAGSCSLFFYCPIWSLLTGTEMTFWYCEIGTEGASRSCSSSFGATIWDPSLLLEILTPDLLANKFSK